MPGTFVDTDHYVHGYWIFDDIELKTDAINIKNSNITDSTPLLKIKLPESAYMVSFISTGELLEMYYDFCRKYDDFGRDPFEGYTYAEGQYEYVHCPMRVFSGVDFSSIDVVSDKDIDEDHPAGTSLADIAVFSTRCARYHLENKKARSAADYTEDEVQWFPMSEGRFISRRFDKLTLEQLSVIGIQTYYSEEEGAEKLYREDFILGGITFMCAPDKLLYNTLTVTMTTVDGRKFEAQAKVTWY